jgi:short-subunit dehydrogenase
MHVILTGASSGIGEAIAKEYLARDASLTLVARRKDKLLALAKGNEKKCHVVEADLTDYMHATDWVDGAIEALGDVDVLINNAGVQIVAPTTATSVEDGERMLHLNVFTPLRLTKYVLPSMIARKKGTIVDIASMAAIAPTPGMFYYNASKGALAAASEGLRGELMHTGVHVMTVYPGPVRTPMEAKGRAAYEETTAMKWLTPTGDADVLAGLICDGVRSGRHRIVYPATYGFARHFPNLTRFVMDRMTPPLKALPDKT